MFFVVGIERDRLKEGSKESRGEREDRIRGTDESG